MVPPCIKCCWLEPAVRHGNKRRQGLSGPGRRRRRRPVQLEGLRAWSTPSWGHWKHRRRTDLHRLQRNGGPRLSYPQWGQRMFPVILCRWRLHSVGCCFVSYNNDACQSFKQLRTASYSLWWRAEPFVAASSSRRPPRVRRRTSGKHGDGGRVLAW